MGMSGAGGDGKRRWGKGTSNRQHEVKVCYDKRCVEDIGMLLADALVDKPPKW